MMLEELGIVTDDSNPMWNALVTFIAFVMFGFLPILPFVVGEIAGTSDNLYDISMAMTGFSFFLIGSIKSKFSHTPWYKAGTETFIIGSIAAAASYFIGKAFEGLQTSN
jgi:VIT1/CCC1 family predicted Fe2+/Mn2+ transporter